jgi:hypothetical protein
MSFLDAYPMRPTFPDAEQIRCDRHALRWLILHEECEERVVEWMKTQVGADRLASWGNPDTAFLALAQIARQLSTPGLYESPPIIGNADTQARALGDPDGPLKDSGLWALQQHVQYLSVGMGDCIAADELTDAGLGHRIVHPADVVMHGHADRPEDPVFYRELRLRYDSPGERWVWTWDEYDIRDLSNPRFRVLMITGDTEIDATNMWIDVDSEPAPVGGLTGALYRWRDPERVDAAKYPLGEPFIPRTVYRSASTGRIWNDHHMRSVVIGTLQGVMFQTFTGRAALDAAGSSVVGIDVEPQFTGIRTERADGTGEVLRTVALTPGSMSFLHSREGAKNPHVQVIGPGQNLGALSGFSTQYGAQLAMAWGLNPGDLLRTSKDPTSGAALAISESGRLRYSRRFALHAERADCERMRKIACILRANPATGYTGATSGWTIQYPGLELAPGEAQAERDDIEWQTEHGYMSPVDGYQRLHPGVGADAARESIIAARVEAAAIDAEVARRLAERGIPASTPSTTTPPAQPSASPAKV